MRTIFVLVAMLMLAPVTHAQIDACTESEPCEAFLTLDDQGLDPDEAWFDVTLVAGDVYTVDVSNLDDVDHTLSIAEADFTLDIGSYGEATATVTFASEGTYTLTDSPSGTQHVFTVGAVEEIDDPQSGGDDDSDEAGQGDAQFQPGFGWLAPVLALAAVAVGIRRP